MGEHSGGACPSPRLCAGSLRADEPGGGPCHRAVTAEPPGRGGGDAREERPKQPQGKAAPLVGLFVLVFVCFSGGKPFKITHSPTDAFHRGEEGGKARCAPVTAATGKLSPERTVCWGVFTVQSLEGTPHLFLSGNNSGEENDY